MVIVGFNVALVLANPSSDSSRTGQRGSQHQNSARRSTPRPRCLMGPPPLRWQCITVFADKSRTFIVRKPACRPTHSPRRLLLEKGFVQRASLHCR